MRFMLGVDVGGTFTDFVAYDAESKAIEVWKELSVPADPVAGILNGLADFTGSGAIDNIRLGTTVATNAMLERKGAIVAYVTTKGFTRRALHPARQPQVPLRHELGEAQAAGQAPPLLRARPSASTPMARVVTPLDEAEVRAVAAAIRAEPEIEAVAVCLLFSYLNPAHEHAVKAILAEELPGLPLSISYEVLPKWKEYERASTTHRRRLSQAGRQPASCARCASGSTRPASPRHTVVIKSNGGEMTLEAAAARARSTWWSPARPAA